MADDRMSGHDKPIVRHAVGACCIRLSTLHLDLVYAVDTDDIAAPHIGGLCRICLTVYARCPAQTPRSRHRSRPIQRECGPAHLHSASDPTNGGPKNRSRDLIAAFFKRRSIAVRKEASSSTTYACPGKSSPHRLTSTHPASYQALNTAF